MCCSVRLAGPRGLRGPTGPAGTTTVVTTGAGLLMDSFIAGDPPVPIYADAQPVQVGDILNIGAGVTALFSVAFTEDSISPGSSLSVYLLDLDMGVTGLSGEYGVFQATGSTGTVDPDPFDSLVNNEVGTLYIYNGPGSNTTYGITGVIGVEAFVDIDGAGEPILVYGVTGFTGYGGTLIYQESYRNLRTVSSADPRVRFTITFRAMTISGNVAIFVSYNTDGVDDANDFAVISNIVSSALSEDPTV